MEGGKQREQQEWGRRNPCTYLFPHVLATTPGLDHEARRFPVDARSSLLFLLTVCVCVYAFE